MVAEDLARSRHDRRAVRHARSGTLSDNGGATQTIPLLAGSPAIDAGEGCSPTDQRGLPRKGPCDLGAFELQ